MTRFAKFAAPLFAIALLLGLATLTQADNPERISTDADNNITLDGVSLGDHVMGPELKTDDLKGKVVLFEYWGDRCPPCHDSIPGIVDLRGDYSADKLAIVANQVWTKDADKTKKAWEKHGGDDTVTVVNHGKLEGAKHRGVPHAYVLDHNGKLIWNGNPHPRADKKEMIKVIKKAVEALPDKA
ncbi:MAG: TlpA disulfide reductase family protein [Planctomycetota bacterium]